MATEVVRAPNIAEFLRELENTSMSPSTASPMSEFYQWALARQRNRGNASALPAALFPAAAKSSVSLTKTSAVLLCDLLGAMCLFLNLFVLFALIRNRKRVLQNVFYVIVLHCAFVDIIRGTCLIIWGIPHLLIYNVPTMEYRLLALKINQIVLIILRSCNLLTIFNLLVFTTNEFIVIKYPLHYRRYFRRQTVVIMLICSWVISLTFGVGSVFSNFFESAHSILVLSNRNVTLSDDSPLVTRRREQDSVSVNSLSMVMIFALCYLCLFVVLVCYGAILRTIRRFHSLDSKGVFNNDDSQRIRSTKKFVAEKDSTNGSSLKVNADGERCNSHRRWKNHLMSRHKYLIVIGSVLFVDVLFLFPYSGIQMVAFLHLNNVMTTTSSSTIIRWGLQILIGVHSVIQPLCYFRMTEFRRLALCRKRRNVCNRSQSFSHLQRSYAQTKDQPLHTTADDDLGRLKEPNLDDVSGENDALLRRTSFDQMFLTSNWKRVESVKFRTYGQQEETSPKKKISSIRSSTCYELESLFILDDAEQQPIAANEGFD